MAKPIVLEAINPRHPSFLRQKEGQLRVLYRSAFPGNPGPSPRLRSAPAPRAPPGRACPRVAAV